MGEIGGTDEEEAAQFIRRHVSKPVVAFIAGQTAPPGKRMGHAGAIIAGAKGTAAEKMAAFAAAGVAVARIPSEFPQLIREALERRRGRAKSAARPKSARRAGARLVKPKRVSHPVKKSASATRPGVRRGRAS